MARMALDDLRPLTTFVEAAERGTLRKAAAAQGITPQAASQALAQLERRLGVTLFRRTTRVITLTDEGSRLLSSAKPALQALRDALGSVRSTPGGLSGTLRISCPRSAFAGVLRPMIAEFSDRHPAVRPVVHIDDRHGRPPDSESNIRFQAGGSAGAGEIERRLFPLQRVVCASPEYSRRHGLPASPAELSRLRQCALQDPATGRFAPWRLRFGKDLVEHPVIAPVLCSNDESVVLDSVISGVGVGQFDAIAIAEHVRAGRLVPILVDHLFDDEWFLIAWSSHEALAPQAQAFVDLATSRLSDSSEFVLRPDELAARTGSDSDGGDRRHRSVARPIPRSPSLRVLEQATHESTKVSEPLASEPSSSTHEGPRRSLVPAAKLTPPILQAGQIVRAPLLERFDAATSARLLLLRAAPGFGKTTLMAQMSDRVRAGGGASAWLTLDQADNDTVRFLVSLRTALSIGSEERPGTTSIDILEWISGRANPITIFLDDYELIRESAVGALVASIVDALPRGSRLVIGTRTLPDLPLARLRAHGELLELDSEALRFDASEVKLLLRRLSGAELSDAAIAQLHLRTAGWVTALVLAGPSLVDAGDEFVDRLFGSDQAVAEYLSEEVFARQSQPVQDFLLGSSILRHLDAPLCRALMPDVDATAMLAQLEKQNLFTMALPTDVPAWRYHRVFADFLRTRLVERHPSRAADLHRRACAWYESQRRIVPAIDHALAAEDHATAMRLLESSAQSLLEEGRMRLLARWFDAIPGDVMIGQPTLQAVSIWAMLFTRGPVDATARLEGSRCEADENPYVRAHVNALRPLMLIMQDRYDEGLDVGRRNLALLPTGNSFADNALRNAMAHVYSVMGDSRRARELIDEAVRQSGDATFHRMYSESQLGMEDLQRGRLRLATSHFRAAVAASQAAGDSYSSASAWAGLLLAGNHYEAGDFEAAERLVDVYLPMARDVGMPGHVNLGYRIRTTIAFSRGEVERSYESIAELEAFGHRRRMQRLVCNARLLRAHLLLLQGRAPDSSEELERANDPDVWDRIRRQRLPANETDFYELARVRWTVHFGDAASTLPLLGQWIAESVEQHRLRRALRLRVLESLALQRSGNPAGAASAMALAVRQAAQEGFVRVIADEGHEVARIVERLDAMHQEVPSNRSDARLHGYLKKLLAAFGTLPRDSGKAPEPHPPIEALTRKELQVLQLAADGYSNAAMVQQLKASDSTVRTHLRNISSKMGTRSRTEAVAIGRRLGIIR